MENNSKELKVKVPPQALEAEEAVLGAMLTSKEAVSRGLEILISDHFYKDSHRRIFESMNNLFDEGEPVDAVSVINELKKRKKLDASGGAYFLTGLADSVPTSANIDYYAQIVLEKASLRRLISVATDLSSDAFNDEHGLEDILDRAEQRIFSISLGRLKG